MLPPHYAALSLMLAECCGGLKQNAGRSKTQALPRRALLLFLLFQLPVITDAEKMIRIFQGTFGPRMCTLSFIFLSVFVLQRSAGAAEPATGSPP